MTPATIATAVPFPSDFAFSAISVLASSISSRTSSEVFSETSPTTSPRDFWALPPFSVIVAAADRLQELREDEAADEGGEHRILRVGRGWMRGRVRADRRRRARAVAAG